MISTVLPYRGRNISQRSTRWLLSLVANLRLVSTLRGGMTSVTLLTLAARTDRGVPRQWPGSALLSEVPSSWKGSCAVP